MPYSVFECFKNTCHLNTASSLKIEIQEFKELNKYSCIDIYAHTCLKPFSIGQKPCSNSETHVQIMKFTCRLNMGFGRRHWSMRRYVMCFVETKWPMLKKLRGFLFVFSRYQYSFQEILSGIDWKCKNNDQPWFVSVFKHSMDHEEGV